MPARTAREFLASAFFLVTVTGCHRAGTTSESGGQGLNDPLSQVVFLHGSWRTSDINGSVTQESWTSPAGGTMMGVGRVIENGQTSFFEYLRIESTERGVIYFASPRGQAFTPFPLKESSLHRVVFENPEHHFPSRITYWLDASRKLHARIEGNRPNSPEAEEWIYERED